jgi:hypothetical protein
MNTLQTGKTEPADAPRFFVCSVDFRMLRILFLISSFSAAIG